MSDLTGVVSDRLWPLIPLVVGGERIWALMDTGFEGYLMVSDADRRRLNVLRTSRYASSVNADGTDSVVAIGRVTFDWLGKSLTVDAHVPSAVIFDSMTYDGRPILGVAGLFLLQGLRLCIDLYPGREVLIEGAP